MFRLCSQKVYVKLLIPQEKVSSHLQLCPQQKYIGRLGGSAGEASASSSGLDVRILGSSPVSGALLSGESASSSHSPSAPPPACVRSLK